MVRDEHVCAMLDRAGYGLARGVEREYDARDPAVGVAGEKPDAVPLLGPLGREACRDGPFYVRDDDGTHSSIDLQPPYPSGKRTSV